MLHASRSHTHYLLLRRVGFCTILNPGSVGQPRDEGAVASWASIDFKTGKTAFHRVPFDPADALHDAKRYDPEYSYLQDILSRKRKI